MNKLEANLSLLVITFFAGIQYVFLAGVPASVSSFAFLSITNLVGFLVTLVVFFSELVRIDRRQILQSVLLALELFGFNLFLLLGSAGLSATVSASVLAGYFIFVPVFLLLFRQKVSSSSLLGAATVVLGLCLSLEVQFTAFTNVYVLYLLLADVCFALYLVTVDRFCVKSNPSILAMGQMFFGFLLAVVGWVIHAAITGSGFSLPSDLGFWCGVVFISFFIRGLYGVVQIYAQRYVSALNTSLIFSLEIVITMLMSSVLAMLFGTTAEPLNFPKIAGCGLIMLGVLIADGALITAVKRRWTHEES